MMINKLVPKIINNIQSSKNYATSFLGRMPNLKKTLEVDVFIATSKKTKNKDLVGKIFDLLNDTKIKRAKKTYKQIEFIPAKTLEEAHEYARKIGASELYLGKNDTLEVLNFLNEGFTKFKNAHLGLAEIPRRVYFKDSGEQNLMSASSMFKSFYINENIFGIDKIDENIQKRLDDIVDSFCDRGEKGIEIPLFYSDIEEIEYMENLINTYCKNKNQLNYGQKVELYTILSDMKYNVSLFAYKPKDFAKKLFSQKNVFTNCKPELKKKHLEEILSTETDFDALRIFSRILREEQENFKIKGTNSKFSTLLHEMGHLQDYFEERTPASGKYKSEELYPESLKEWLSNERTQSIAFNVSSYATTGPGEFIAETYAKLLSGDSVSEEAIALYKELKGPKIPNII